MKCSFRNVMLAVLALSCLCGYRAYAQGTRPVIGGIPYSSLFEAKTAVGSDGMLRLIFDYNPSLFPIDTYSGSALWIIDPNGSVVAAGSPTIPASVGSEAFILEVISHSFSALTQRSNTAIFAQADGNTTVLFYYSAGLPSFTALGSTNSFGVWTYNSGGSLISAAAYGPFSGLTLAGLYFDPSGKAIARWRAGTSAFSPVAGWVLDEFGTIANSTVFYGGFGNTFLGKIRINSSNQQIWPFALNNGNGTYTTTIWTFNSSGSLEHAQVYGPF